jgi:hypothetical protein
MKMVYNICEFLKKERFVMKIMNVIKKYCQSLKIGILGGVLCGAIFSWTSSVIAESSHQGSSVSMSSESSAAVLTDAEKLVICKNYKDASYSLDGLNKVCKEEVYKKYWKERCINLIVSSDNASSSSGGAYTGASAGASAGASSGATRQLGRSKIRLPFTLPQNSDCEKSVCIGARSCLSDDKGGCESPDYLKYCKDYNKMCKDSFCHSFSAFK